jgi:hypothetical protein
MRAPVRLRDDPSAPADVREMVRSGKRSRPMSREARGRSAARLNRSVILLPAAAGLVMWVKGVAIAAACVAAATVAFRVVPMRARGEGRPKALSPTDLGAAPATPRPAGTVATPPLERLEPPKDDGAGGPAPAVSSAPRNGASVGERRTSPARGGTPVFTLPASPKLFASPNEDSRAEKNPLEREAALLEEARALLDRRPRAALEVLDRHAADFPAGQLSMECELLAVDALRRLERVAEARARGNALLAQARGSIYEPRVRAMLGELGTP